LLGSLGQALNAYAHQKPPEHSLPPSKAHSDISPDYSAGKFQSYFQFYDDDLTHYCFGYHGDFRGWSQSFEDLQLQLALVLIVLAIVILLGETFLFSICFHFNSEYPNVAVLLQSFE